MLGGNLLQDPSSRSLRLRKSTDVAERAVGDNRDAFLFAPGNDGVLDRALLQMIEHLIAGRFACLRDPAQRVEIVHVEIADAPRQDLALGVQSLERCDGVGKGMRPAPVEKVAIEAVSSKTFQRPLTGGDRPLPRSVMRQDRGGEENLVSPAGDGLSGPTLGSARTIHLRRIDMRHAEIEASAQTGDRGLGASLLDIPGALADDRDFALRRTERTLIHDLPVA